MQPRSSARAWWSAATLALVCGLGSTMAAAQSLTVAAASDLQTALPDIAARFEKSTGRKVALSFGSSGNFSAQIENGAPFDVFLSADVDYPRQLARSGKADLSSLYEYATGRLVLWSRSDSGIDARRGLAVLTDPRTRRISMANPEHAPYGRAAVAALRHEGLYDRVREKVVLGENISQAAQFAQSGAADVGLLALSLALSPALKSSGAYFEIPAEWHPPIQQAAIIVSASPNKPLAQQFIAYLKSRDAVEILRANGFAVPQVTP